MNKPDRFEIEQLARQLRRQETSRLFNLAVATVTNWLRERHESALRRRPRSIRMRSANATPA